MSLLKPGLGDVLDRLTVVAMKRMRVREGGDADQALDREWVELHDHLRAEIGEDACKVAIATAELAAINGAIWALVEAVGADDPRQRLNELRVAVRRAIGSEEVKV